MKLIPRVMLLFLVAIWVEQSLLPFLLPGRVSFRLVTLIVISLGVTRGPVLGGVTGFLLGIPVSLMTSEPLGVGSLSLTCVGYLAGWVAERLHLALPGTTFVLTVVLLALEWALTSAMAWMMFDVTYQFSWMNFVSAILVSPAVLWLCKPFFTREAAPLYG